MIDQHVSLIVALTKQHLISVFFLAFCFDLPWSMDLIHCTIHAGKHSYLMAMILLCPFLMDNRISAYIHHGWATLSNTSMSQCLHCSTLQKIDLWSTYTSDTGAARGYGMASPLFLLRIWFELHHSTQILSSLCQNAAVRCNHLLNIERPLTSNLLPDFDISTLHFGSRLLCF